MDSREARDLMASRQEEENRELKAENNRLREALAAAEKVVEAARVYTSDFECDFFAAYDKLKEEK